MLALFKHLLPRALPWSITVDKSLRRFFEGLAGLPSDVRTFVDLVYLDVWPSTTRELATWERQFALSPGGTEIDRRGKVAAAWSIQGRQSPDYIQRALHAAGFTSVYVHEWWYVPEPDPPDPLELYQCEASTPWECFEPGIEEPLAPHCYDGVAPPPGEPVVTRAARDPRDYTTQPLTGSFQCEASSPWQCFAPGPGDPLAPHCDAVLANDPGYVVNLDLTRRAPPPVPDDPQRWPFFLYLAGEAFPTRAPVLGSRLPELKELILRLAPAQQWIVLLVDPVDELGGFGTGPFGGAPFGP